MNLQIFLIVVDKRDEDLFSTLKNNYNKQELIWGFQKKDVSAWTKINRDDIICMILEGTASVQLYGKIIKTNMDMELPKKWGRDIRTLQMTHMIYFTKLQKSHKLFDSVQKHIVKNKIIVPGVYRILDGNISKLNPSEKQINDKHIKMPMDLDGPPARIKYEIVRFIRDTQKSRQLKKIYKNRCQVCSYRLEIGTEVCYSEVHHIRPLSEGGDDDFNNMLVLCPTHHAEFDYGVICINEDLTHVIDKNHNKVGTITISVEHTIALDNIKDNLKRVCA